MVDFNSLNIFSSMALLSTYTDEEEDHINFKIDSRNQPRFSEKKLRSLSVHKSDSVCVCVYVCMYVCKYVCMYV